MFYAIRFVDTQSWDSTWILSDDKEFIENRTNKIVADYKAAFNESQTNNWDTTPFEAFEAYYTKEGFISFYDGTDDDDDFYYDDEIDSIIAYGEPVEIIKTVQMIY